MDDDALRAKMVDLYQKVQNIPYAFSLPRNPDLIFQKNKGICSEKNMFLAKQFHDWGVPARFVLMTFDWNSTPVPKKVIATRSTSSDLHLALKIKPQDKWVFVDATWDPPLRDAGFNVGDKWDGTSNTELAVSPLIKLTFPFWVYWPFKILLRLRENNSMRFQIALNEYLRRIRTS
jgi:hypothetical protein